MMRQPSTVTRAARLPVTFALAVGVALLLHSSIAQADNIWTHIVEPTADDFVLGQVEIVAEVVGPEPVAEVEFYVDGRAVGVLTDAPFRIRVDLGEENLGHLFKVVARNVKGDSATATVETQPVPIGAGYEVELQQLYVTATKHGLRVLDLQPEDFVIRDNDEIQKLVTFAIGDLPFTAVLLIDASASMFGDKLAYATAGAATFVRGMQELDRAKVLVYSHQVLNTTPFTGNHDVLATALSGSHASGGTALHDHLFAALKLLEQRQGRRVIVLLSDGVDTHSILSMEQAFRKARHSQALIYWIRLSRATGGLAPDDPKTKMRSAWRGPTEYRDQFALLQQTVEDSGGRIIKVDKVNRIERVFVQILAELREQYALGYYPSSQENDGSWHEVQVKIKRPGVDVRTHQGYIDF